MDVKFPVNFEPQKQNKHDTRPAFRCTESTFITFFVVQCDVQCAMYRIIRNTLHVPAYGNAEGEPKRLNYAITRGDFFSQKPMPPHHLAALSDKAYQYP